MCVYVCVYIYIQTQRYVNPECPSTLRCAAGPGTTAVDREKRSSPG